MRHAKHTFKLSRTGSHRRCLIANMLKSLIDNERIVTTTAKAKELRRHADKVITYAKKDTLAAKRKVISKLMIRYNTLTPKEKRAAKNGNTSSYNVDRKVINKLFIDLKDRFKDRNGGYTRVLKLEAPRVGDGGEKCIIEYIK
ncbi:MAG: 50S ribosomal protein L17 [Candidatus Anoxychlamydiales bacterium]|nr:50S ribosomal protein L17 [Candidatus Anoxychlamydiales bacterium]